MFVLTLIVSKFLILYGQEWGYEGETGPTNWPKLFPEECAGNRQSPININKCLVRMNNQLGPIKFTNYDKALESFTLENTGKTFDFFPPADTKYTISGGGLDGTYNLVQFHYHWRCNSTGSEHTINCRQYTCEIHFVHLSEKYNSIDEAAGSSDGIAVLGGLYVIDPNPKNDLLEEIVQNLDKVREAHAEFEVKVDPAKRLTLSMLLPDKPESYYRYYGSLTVPKCNETVVWTVFTETLKISCNQLAEFCKLLNHYGKPITQNFRPPQPLNGRVVQYSQGCSFWGHIFPFCLF